MMLDQNDTEFVDRLTGQLERAPTPASDEALLGRIHATIASGGARPSTSARPRWPWWIAGVAAAVFLVAITYRETRPVTAGSMSGTLHFDPASPQAGQTIRVRYTPAAALASFDHLRLRARFRTARGTPGNWPASQVEAARLTRSAGGEFVGSFVLGDSVVFGTFAVEDDSARYVDSNHRALWTLLVSDSTGTPTFEALEQGVDDVAMTNWELSLATAQRLTSLYPTDARGWVILYYLEQSMLPRAKRDSARAVHLSRLPVLDARVATGNATSDELGGMVSYAKLLNDTVRVQRWRDLLVRSNPGGVWGLTEYNYRGIALIPKQPRQALAFFDSLWTAVGPVHPGITIFGFSAAQAANDSAALETWFHRTLASGHADSIQTASMMLRVPSLADEALALLRAALVTTEAAADGRRDLELSRTAARSAEEDRRARTLDALGNALITRGRLRAGVDTLALAATIGWSPPRYRTVAAKALTLGDTVQAIEAFAHVAADPATVASFADSVRTLVGPRFDAQSWKQLVSGATAEMKRRMLARAERTALPNVSITDARARSRRLSELVDGRPTLVAFWSMYCFYSLAQHAELAATAHRLATLGYNTVAITNGRLDSATLDTLAAHKWDFPPYRDGNNEARVAFAQFGTPEYFVLDGKGRVRFRLTTLANAPAQLVSVDDR